MAKMLIVDDEEEICQFLEEFFRDKGYQVLTASRGDAAVEMVRTEKPDILLLDIVMPGKDGIETLRAVKEIHPHMKVIMVTALESEDKIEAALELGADNYITKPLSLEYLEQDVQAKVSKSIE